MSVWRRACLGQRRASVALLALWFGMSVWLGLIACLAVGWREGLLVTAVAAAAVQAVFWTRRMRWNRWIRTQGIEAVAAVEVLLRNPGSEPR